MTNGRDRMNKFIGENWTELSLIAENIKNQDNNITAEPVFLVQKMVEIPTSSDWADDYEWCDTEGDHVRASEDQSKELDIMEGELADTSPWEKFYYIKNWETDQAFFTLSGAEEYRRINGRNIGKSRIYVGGSFRNNEYRLIRNLLTSIVCEGVVNR